jgi:hypothetical protein
VLGAADVAGYLIDRNLLSPRAVVDGDFGSRTRRG